MGSQAEADYAAFEEKVRRTVYIDNLSPQVTESVVRTALDQFGTVKHVHFIPNYLGPRNLSQCALVEVEKADEAKSIVIQLSEHPFMMSGMPRPVRARAAEVEMFDDRPVKPGRRIYCRWLDESDPDFEVANKLKLTAKRHAAEASFLLSKQLEEEEKLAKQQAQALEANRKKYETIDNIMADGAVSRLARHYNIRISNDR
ncbi:RRM_1 domain-containing protein [Cephalotus follicularis]|uniref:RRM_1 domain-containing protein n=1 Tax=Cephalotus follicularis TaxID=3775 RepID=A0A1Q3BEW5_CEPFO|nr:RRM_1 domain-containing protein [Cephalotus follicularis]